MVDDRRVHHGHPGERDYFLVDTGPGHRGWHAFHSDLFRPAHSHGYPVGHACADLLSSQGIYRIRISRKPLRPEDKNTRCVLLPYPPRAFGRDHTVCPCDHSFNDSGLEPVIHNGDDWWLGSHLGHYRGQGGWWSA